jgi:hypothetical protein
VHETLRIQAAQGNVPERGTPEFLLFAQKAYAGRFGETEAIRSLSQEAAAGQPNNRSGFNEARDKFWAAVRDENDPRAQVVRGILDEAGIDLSGDGPPSLTLSGVHDAVDIDHVWPASVPPKDEKDPDPTKWLDPDNLQLMVR